ncbi:bifunctional DNA-formamidopyrimidine glycosylase/DNA-(apurinic or apyrimidinic site) lyase [Spiribacter roseus]|uniref:bifunctional DNA-formamidopyrimidine glycosylase/DNA-(apurinic or apyrimidinic site) lyase n=1 Tax=Spiribacter roseus TaxID=1855875 RepID=UPI00132FB3FB|nr:bifunctional DNA-formamidopyrimidine glycosylase/DNA-(apurinic or apyrimidinic site) lyase [Spiribacter roseus]KAF0284027.1 DNA-formamidopyrimidine glycosylase [Spiribacter roseus]
MPELPEVETTRRGLEPHCVGRVIERAVVRESRLRWPIPAELATAITGARVWQLDRRGKYLIMRLDSGSAVMLHLGMSGYIRVVPPHTPPLKHDHVDFLVGSDCCLRFHDPRRFGSIHLTEEPAESHSLLRSLGPEPFDAWFDGAYLYAQAGNRRLAVKAFIMDSRIVVGVGNIYATEALFRAGIHPARAAGRVSRKRFEGLAATIRAVLAEAIEAGGTTLRDFSRSDGQPGYFQQSLDAYGRGGQPCRRCGRTLRTSRLGQRATVYCPGCQR